MISGRAREGAAASGATGKDHLDGQSGDDGLEGGSGDDQLFGALPLPDVCWGGPQDDGYENCEIEH